MNDEEQQKVDAIMRAIDVLNAAISDLPDAHMIVLNAHELYDGAQKVDGAWIRDPEITATIFRAVARTQADRTRQQPANPTTLSPASGEV